MSLYGHAQVGDTVIVPVFEDPFDDQAFERYTVAEVLDTSADCVDVLTIPTQERCSYSPRECDVFDRPLQPGCDILGRPFRKDAKS